MKKKVFLTIAMLIVVVLSIAGMVGCKDKIIGNSTIWMNVKNFDDLSIIFGKDPIYPPNINNVDYINVRVNYPDVLKGKEGIIEYMEKLVEANWSYSMDGVIVDVQIDKYEFTPDITGLVEGEDYTVINGIPVFRIIEETYVWVTFYTGKYSYDLKVDYPKLNDISDEVKQEHILGMEEYAATFAKK